MARTNNGSDLPQGPSNPAEDKAIIEGMQNANKNGVEAKMGKIVRTVNRATRAGRESVSGSVPMGKVDGLYVPNDAGSRDLPLVRSISTASNRVYTGKAGQSDATVKRFMSKYKGISHAEVDALAESGHFTKAPNVTDAASHDAFVTRLKGYVGRGTSASQKRRDTLAAGSEGAQALKAEIAESPGFAPTEEDQARYTAKAREQGATQMEELKMPSFGDAAGKRTGYRQDMDEHDHGEDMSRIHNQLERVTEVANIPEAARATIWNHLKDAASSIGSHYNSYMSGVDTDQDVARNTGVGTGRGRAADAGLGDIREGSVSHLRNAGNSLVAAAALLHQHVPGFRNMGGHAVVKDAVEQAVTGFKSKVGDVSGAENFGDVEDNRTYAEVHQQHIENMLNRQLAAERVRGNYVAKLPERGETPDEVNARLNRALNITAAKKESEGRNVGGMLVIGHKDDNGVPVTGIANSDGVVRQMNAANANAMGITAGQQAQLREGAKTRLGNEWLKSLAPAATAQQKFDDAVADDKSDKAKIDYQQIGKLRAATEQVAATRDNLRGLIRHYDYNWMNKTDSTNAREIGVQKTPFTPRYVPTEEEEQQRAEAESQRAANQRAAVERRSKRIDAGFEYADEQPRPKNPWGVGSMRPSLKQEAADRRGAIEQKANEETPFRILEKSAEMSPEAGRRAVQDQLGIYEQSDEQRSERGLEFPAENPKLGRSTALSDAIVAARSNPFSVEYGSEPKNLPGRRPSVFENPSYDPTKGGTAKEEKKRRLKVEKRAPMVVNDLTQPTNKGKK